MGLLQALVGISGAVVARVLVALGFSVVTITGVVLVVDQIKEQIIEGLAAGPSAAVHLLGLAGAWDALGMVFGAITFALSYWQLTAATRILGNGGS